MIVPLQARHGYSAAREFAWEDAMEQQLRTIPHDDLHRLKADVLLRSSLAATIREPISVDEAAQFTMLDGQIDCEIETLARRMAIQERS